MQLYSPVGHSSRSLRSMSLDFKEVRKKCFQKMFGTERRRADESVGYAMQRKSWHAHGCGQQWLWSTMAVVSELRETQASERKSSRRAVWKKCRAQIISYGWWLWIVRYSGARLVQQGYIAVC